MRDICTLPGKAGAVCGGHIGPDCTGRPMCYRCGPREMLPTDSPWKQNDALRAEVERLEREINLCIEGAFNADTRAEQMTALALMAVKACQAVEDGKPTDPAFPTEWDQVRAALARAREVIGEG